MRVRRQTVRPGVLFVAGIGVALVAFYLWIDPNNPPGFMRDEAAFAVNGWLLGHGLRDQYGGLLPLYLKSFGDYKTAFFAYVLAVVFRVTGPHASVARAVGAVDVLAALAVVALIAARRTRPAVAVTVVALAGLCPWMYELGRLAFDSTLYPLGVAGVLLATDISLRSRRALWIRASYVAFALAFLTYCYAAGRALGPLLAAALLVFASRERWRWVAAVWVGYAVAWVPNLVYAIRHPGALTARYAQTTYLHPGASPAVSALHGVVNYLQDASLWHLIVSGYPIYYVTLPGYGNLFAALAVLGVLGIVEILLHRRGDRWWLFVILALLLVPVPSALTADRWNPLRLSPQVIVLAVLAVPGLELLLRVPRRSTLRTAVVALLTILAAVTVFQFEQFARLYAKEGTSYRESLFEADVPHILAPVLTSTRTVYIDRDDVRAQTHALWYAVSHGIPTSRVVILPDGGIPPTGAGVFGRDAACDYVCATIATAGRYWTARALGPKPPPPTLRYGSGFHNPEQFQGVTSRWLIQRGRLLVTASRAQWATLGGFAFSNGRPRVLAVETPAGRVLAQESVPTSVLNLAIGPFRIPKGASSLVLVATPGPERLGATDSRLGSVFLEPLALTPASNVPGPP